VSFVDKGWPVLERHSIGTISPVANEGEERTDSHRRNRHVLDIEDIVL
jgi:hypothetical protein